MRVLFVFDAEITLSARFAKMWEKYNREDQATTLYIGDLSHKKLCQPDKIMVFNQKQKNEIAEFTHERPAIMEKIELIPEFLGEKTETKEGWEMEIQCTIKRIKH